jgi:hypothetical protein
MSNMNDNQILSQVIFDPPRRPGGPVICAMANLPAFETWTAAEAYHEKVAPGSMISRKWQCPHCKWWHYESKQRAPSGASSGTERPHWSMMGKYNRH